MVDTLSWQSMTVVGGVASLFYRLAKKGSDRKDVFLCCERLQLFFRVVLWWWSKKMLLLPRYHSMVGME
jgi:hypothetical protein